MKTPNRTVAILLALFLGGLGAHKFYMGKPALGILYLLFCWTGIPSIIALIELIHYLILGDKKFEAKYWKKVE
jgi:TM2 domain-containing membrane protein YozV